MYYDYLNKTIFKSTDEALDALKSIKSNWVDATGDCVKGDKVAFIKVNFSGSFKRPKFLNSQIIIGVIKNDSYGLKQQQHTFTIETVDGELIKIKGRNLYRYLTLRKPWDDEQERLVVLIKKHERGIVARHSRLLRKQEIFL